MAKNNGKPKGKLVWKILCGVFTFLFVFLMIAGPIANNYTISLTYLNREIPWTPETADTATMPRLTTQSGENNFRSGSQWYRDGSFLKLRNVGISYNIPRSLLKICDATVSLTGTNLFSADNIRFADPEQLGANYPTTRVFWAGVKFNF